MENKTKLKIWDFDGTLCDTPLPEVGKPIWEEATGKEWPHIGWWSKVESLDLEIFEHPTLPSVMKDFDKFKDSEECMNVMLTGRRANKKNGPDLEGAVKAILDSHGLKFDKYFHNNGGETGENKMWRMEKLLGQYPNLESIEMWDDRDEHIPRFQEWGDNLVKEGKLKEFKINHVLGEHHGETP